MPIRPVCNSVLRPLTSAVTEGVGGGGIRAASMQSVAFIGDSRTQLAVEQYLDATSADWKGLNVAPSVCGPEITAAGSGTLEFRASDGYMRWTAPSDTAGAWTPSYAGIIRLQSATAGAYLDLSLRTVSDLPGTDQTVSVSCAGDLRLGWWSRGYWVRAMQAMRQIGPAKMLGIGGNTTASVVEQLPWLEAEAGGFGLDVILLGTNDISAGTASATTLANLQTILDARRSLGRKLVLLSETARWSVAGAGTPMSAQEQSDHLAICNFLQQYAADHGCVFVDAFTATYDSGASDRRPAANLLTDYVHFNDLGAQIVGEAVAAALYVGPARAEGSEGNLLGVGYFAGTGGTMGTGATGTAADGWTVGRNSGDVVITANVEARSDVAGNWQVMEFTAASTSRVQAITAAQTLASLGLAAGDQVYFECEVDAASLVNVENLSAWFRFDGASPQQDVSGSLRGSSSSRTKSAAAGVIRTPVAVIPADATSITPRFWVEVGAGSSGVVRIGSAAIVKVA